MYVLCRNSPTAAVGAKLNAEQLHKPEEQRKPVSKITAIAIGFLMIGSIIYHILRWQN